MIFLMQDKCYTNVEKYGESEFYRYNYRDYFNARMRKEHREESFRYYFTHIYRKEDMHPYDFEFKSTFESSPIPRKSPYKCVETFLSSIFKLVRRTGIKGMYTCTIILTRESGEEIIPTISIAYNINTEESIGLFKDIAREMNVMLNQIPELLPEGFIPFANTFYDYIVTDILCCLKLRK